MCIRDSSCADADRLAAAFARESIPLRDLVAAHALRERLVSCAAALAGRPSFGKGKIQAVFGLADDSGLIVTVANYLTPAGTAIQGVGLTPEAGLRGPGLGLLEPPLPSAAQFDDAWDHRVCATK